MSGNVVKIQEPVDFSAVRCILCDTVGKWKNVDEFRYKPQGMHMCETCGFVSYPDVTANAHKLKDHYRDEYRTPPTVANVFSSERKLHYHINFLEPLLEEWKTKNMQPRIVEIGAALGMFLSWFRNRFPKAEIFGTELTKSFVRVAFWIYNIQLQDDADWTKQYDLIMSYKVAEHMPDADEQLKKYRNALSEDGRLYISVPTWFKRMTNFGMQGFDIEYYYEKNHCNVWSRNHFEQLLAKVGFEIVKSDYSMYDDTYLCRKAEPKTDVQFDDPAKRLADLASIRKAAQLYDEARYDEAIKEWPNFPEAHQNNYEKNRAKAHQLGWDGIVENYLKPALDSCPDNPQITLFVGDIHMRYEKWDDAIAFFDRTMKLRPMEAGAVMGMAHCLRQKAQRVPDARLRAKLRQDAMGVVLLNEKHSLQNRYDAITWAMDDAANIPTPHEPGAAAIFSNPPAQAHQ